MDTPQGGRARGLRPRMRLPGPDAASPALNWIGGERIAIGGVPSARLVGRLAEQGVTHIVNCRSRQQVRWSGDLAAERAAFGLGRVAHAPMQDHGLRQRPAVWAAAACFAAQVLTEQQQAGVLIHCSAGRRRSPMLAYAVLRLRGHAPGHAAALVLSYRTEAELVPAYVRSVERWLATTVRWRRRCLTERGDSAHSPAPGASDSAWDAAVSAVPNMPICSRSISAGRRRLTIMHER